MLSFTKHHNYQRVIFQALSFVALVLFHQAANASIHKVNADEVKQITIDNKPSTVLVRPWQGKLRLGAAIIVGRSNANAQAAGVAGYLRTHLNQHGWATVSVTPTIGLYYPNFATAADEVSKAGKNQLSLDTTQATPKFDSDQLLEQQNFQHSQLTETINQLAEIVKPYPGKRMIIALDDSAAIVTQLLYQRKIPTPDTLVVINPYRAFEQEMVSGKEMLSVAQQLQILSMPILDLQSRDGHPISQEQAQERKMKNQIKPVRYYSQHQLDLNITTETGWQEALNYIRGFSRRTATY
ncbi:DUF3530 family protein [Shewanella maritima]|uniref:DUF3530 family protein n=1 Tax=Shewanella maritima TaxID=2520507 RepID=UPI0013EE64FA|nr:DUF3530 family protein [Shewanella maritima]